MTDKTGFSTPSGSVQVSEASGAFDESLALINGVATWSLPELGAGVYTVTATYGGDAVHATARSKSTKLTIDKFDTTLVLEVAPDPAKVGENATFTATLAKIDTFDMSSTALPAPTGQVQFIDEDNVTLATIALANSRAVFATTTLPPGDHAVFARYTADALYAGSDSDPASITVIERATKTTLKAAPNPAVAGQTVVVTATVTENTLATVDVAETSDAEEKDFGERAVAAAISPTGSVTFLDGDGAELGVAPLTGGKATLRLTNLTAGNHVVIGNYAGDSRYAQSESASLTIKVQALPLAVNDAAGALPGEAVLITVLANDSDPAKGGLTVIDVETPSYGVAAIAGSGQQVRYTAAAGFTGVDKFTYTMSDINDHTDQATVFVIVGSREHSDAPPQVQIFDPAQKGTTTFTGGKVDLDLAWQAGFFAGATQDKDIYFFSFTDYITPTQHTASPPVNYEFGNLNFALDVYLNEQKLDATQLTTPITTTLVYGPDLLGTMRADTLALFRWAGADWSQNGITQVSHTPELQEMVVQLSDVGEFAFYAAPAATANIYMPLLATRNAVTGVEPPKLGVPAVAPTPNTSAPRAGVSPAGWSDQVYLPTVKK
ncbi:MAG: Ig-like domain repeat protein [Anaerolineales bacterium]|nr:Ig-like domain repeat protein [Anaerolineales bacterium]